MKNYYHIHEISKLYHIGQDSLRYYEKAGLISPKRSEKNYRQYSISDIWKLNIIRDLLNLGFSTTRIKEYMDHRSVASSLSLLEEEEQAVLQQIDQLQASLLDVQKRRHDINMALQETLDTPTLRYFPNRRCIRLKDRIEKDEDIDFLLTKLSSTVEANLSIIGNCDTGSMLDESEGQYHFTSVFICLNDQQLEPDFIIPQGQYLTITYRGKYDSHHEHVERMQQEIHRQGWKKDGKFLEFLLIDIHETQSTKEYITQIQVHVLT